MENCSIHSLKIIGKPAATNEHFSRTACCYKVDSLRPFAHGKCDVRLPRGALDICIKSGAATSPSPSEEASDEESDDESDDKGWPAAAFGAGSTCSVFGKLEPAPSWQYHACSSIEASVDGFSHESSMSGFAFGASKGSTSVRSSDTPKGGFTGPGMAGPAATNLPDREQSGMKRPLRTFAVV